MKPIATTVGRESEAQQMFSKRKVRIPDPTQSAWSRCPAAPPSPHPL